MSVLRKTSITEHDPALWNHAANATNVQTFQRIPPPLVPFLPYHTELQRFFAF